MDLNTLKSWLDLISGAVALITGLVAAFWAYTKFVLERGLLPPIQFDIECKAVGLQTDKIVLEILLHLKNLGTSTLVAANIRADVLYLDVRDELSLFDNPDKPTFGRLRFPKSLVKELRHGEKADTNQRGFDIVAYDTFVQPGVDQIYTLVTAIPESTSYVLVWSSFNYGVHPSHFQRLILFLSRRLGLIQYSLDHVTQPHTSERVFRVRSTKPKQ